jgi:carbon storage regulator
MLVLSRKLGESVIIDENTIVTVVDIRGDKVRLGFSAPKEVPIQREEVFRAVHAETHSEAELDGLFPKARGK